MTIRPIIPLRERILNVSNKVLKIGSDVAERAEYLEGRRKKKKKARSKKTSKVSVVS